VTNQDLLVAVKSRTAKQECSFTPWCLRCLPAKSDCLQEPRGQRRADQLITM
jgi:hypothetical protein